MALNICEQLDDLAARRVLILDGGMGSLIQSWRSPEGRPLEEADYRGSRFANHPLPLKGCADILCLTRPDIISSIHEAYLEAGADIIETCSLNATAVSLESFGLGDKAYEISAAAAALARKAADKFSAPGKPRLVAGSIGPTAKSASITSDMDTPLNRTVSREELEAAYYDNARGLLDGGADLILVETIYDALNAKAAQSAVNRLNEERHIRVPLIISATVSEGGFLLTGQDLKAFCTALLPAGLWAVGLNCSFGADRLKPFLTELAAFAPCPIIAYPNAGLPDREGRYSESPEIMANHIESWLAEGLVNIVGGCCGSTPAHIAAIAKKAVHHTPRKIPPAPEGKLFLSGTKVLEWNGSLSLEAAGGLRTVGGSEEKFLRAVKKGDYEDAIDAAREEAEGGADILLLRIDTAPNPEEAVKSLIFLANCFPDMAKLPVCIESAYPKTIEAGLSCLQGRGAFIYTGNKEEDEAALKRLVKKYGAWRF
ncbi:hypothetical protein FACS1894147_05540 [Spirochaetia bacterium]|nr:hypothetical protein FACS1894147_05540 [Spirochaetia bacterium]